MSGDREDSRREQVFPHNKLTVMGVLNLTPDSFSDSATLLLPSERPDIDKVVDKASKLIASKVDILDIGGESTRPGAEAVSVGREIERVLPAVEALTKRFDFVISIDTRKALVASAALDAGAAIVNDVSGFRHDLDLPEICRRAKGVILGHLRDEPQSMQDNIKFKDLLSEVARELSCSYEKARTVGIPHSSICLDPGIGFGKTFAQNLELIANADLLRSRLPCEVAILFGISRKAFLGEFVSGGPIARDFLSHVAGAVALFLGATIIRVHAVAEAVQMKNLIGALRSARRLM